MFNKDITILLTVYNRPKFTEKWLDYANEIKLPFIIFIADGGKDNQVSSIIKKNNYKNIKINYHKFEYYRNFKNFFKKFHQSCLKIKSNYIYICEDDDFIYPKNILKSYYFLKKNSDYSCSGGVNFRYHSFKYQNKLYNYFHLQDENINKPIKNKYSFDRLINLFSNLDSNWNCLHRKKSLIYTFNYMSKKNFINYLLTENIFIAFTTFFGKINRFRHIEYLKTDEISQSSSNIFSKNGYKKFFFHKSKKSELNYFFEKINIKKKDKEKFDIFKKIFISKFFEYEKMLLESEKFFPKIISVIRYFLNSFLKKIKIFYFLKYIKFNFYHIFKEGLYFDCLNSYKLYKNDHNFIKRVIVFTKKNT